MAQANITGNYKEDAPASGTDLLADLNSIITILNAITNEQVGDGIITTSKINAAAITLSKIATGVFTADSDGRAKFATGFVNLSLLAAEVKRPYLRCIEQQSSGVGGHNNAAIVSADLGNWLTRFLNQKTDDGVTATLSSNAITLPAGTYQCSISTPVQRCSDAQTRLQQTSGAAATLLLGQSVSCSTSSTNTIISNVNGQFTLAGSETVEVQMQAGATAGAGSTPFGHPTGFGNEIYTIAEFWKVA